MPRSPVLHREALANTIGDYLGYPRRGRKGKAYEIVQAIIQTIIEGLRRGEKVSIEQVGVFSLRRRKRRSPCPLTIKVEGQKYRKYVGWSMRELPERYTVIFTPSKVVLRNLNNADRDASINEAR
jgi:nucleoid DNA-binding protein